MKRVIDLLNEAIGILNEIKSGNKNVLKVELSTLRAGEVFKIDKHDFIVLEQYEGITKVILKDFMAANVVFDERTRDYSKSKIREKIETDILPVIENAVGADNIVEHEVSLKSVDFQKEFENVKCKVRLITFEEARIYNNYIVNDELDDWWWSCTPWSTEKRGYNRSVAVVSPSGSIYDDDCDYVLGVRPVCILKSNIFVSKGEQVDGQI